MRESLGNVKRALKTLNLELSWFSSVVEKEGGGARFSNGIRFDPRIQCEENKGQRMN